MAQAPVATEGQAPDIVIIDGIACDGDTGERLYPEGKPAFTVNDQGSAEWVGSKLVDMDIEIRNLAMRRDAFERRFKEQLEEFAWDQLPKKKDGTTPKKKTWLCPFVEIKFTTSRASLKVSDDDELKDRAWAWTLEECPGAITTKTIRSLAVSVLPDMTPEEYDQRGFIYKPGGDRIGIYILGAHFQPKYCILRV